MTEITFSIIVPTYNRADKIGDTINALWAQDFPKEGYEIIISNDGSTDGTEKVLNKMGVFHIVQDNKGAASARNRGAELAKNEWLVFTDDDVLLPKNALSSYASAINTMPNILFFGGYIEADDETLKNSAHARYEAHKNMRYGQHVDAPVIGGFETAGCTTGNMCIRKDVFMNMGGFNETFPCAAGEDAEFKMRYARSGKKMCFIPLRGIHKQDYGINTFIKQSKSRGIGGEYYDKVMGKRKSRGELSVRLLYGGLKAMVLPFPWNWSGLEQYYANSARIRHRRMMSASKEHYQELSESKAFDAIERGKI